MNSLERLKINIFSTYLLILLVHYISICLLIAMPAAASDTIEFKLSWDANIEDDLDGYEIYLREGVSNSFYRMIGDVYVDELVDPDNPMVTITNLYNGALSTPEIPSIRTTALEEGTVFMLALTAFDAEGNVSDFSEEICVEVIGSTVTDCRSVNSGESVDSSSDGGSGGGGCFIKATSYEPLTTIERLFVIFTLGCIFCLCKHERIKKQNG